MMQIFTHYDSLPGSAHGAVIAIGNFDGVHKGHQTLLSHARKLADEKGVPMGVLTFEPHPRCLFRPDEPPFRITPAALKQERLSAAGADIVFSINFDWDFASQTPAEFIENVLQNGIQPVHIVVGYDFCFGQLRKGTPDTLRDAGYGVTVMEKIADDGDAVYSSSSIRQALRHGRIHKANDHLGWEWEMRGTVTKGDQRGRELGYPTANVPLEDTIHPSYGVYATWVSVGDDDVWFPAATNIGIRPMFEIEVGQIEAYIFDFDKDIYGQTLRVRPVKRLRGEAKFTSLEELITQIKKDCHEAATVLGVDYKS